MKRKLPPFAARYGWRQNRSAHGVEFYHYPSDLARQLWLYVFSIGHARMKPGQICDHPAQDRYLLHFVERGALWHRIGRKTFVAKRGEACLMDLGRATIHGCEGTQSAVSWWVCFNGKDMARYFSELRADFDPIFPRLDAGAVVPLFDRLIHLTEHEDNACEPRASGLLALLLAELYAERAQERPMISLGADTRLYSEPVRKGIDWMVRLYDQPHSMKQLCEAVGYSRSHYTRLFSRETGVAPIVWLNRYRVEQARRLLVQSDKTAGEIARAVGIPDPNYFSRIFRQCEKLSPQEYRKKHASR